MGTRILNGIYTPTLELGLGPKGHPNFVKREDLAHAWFTTRALPPLPRTGPGLELTVYTYP